MTCILDDDEADLEAEIQRELEALGDDSLQIEDVEDNTSTISVKADVVSPNDKLRFQNFMKFYSVQFKFNILIHSVV